MDLRGRKVVVVGMGRSGLGAVRLLRREGAEPFVTDSQQGPAIDETRAQLEAWGVAHESGRHSAAAFRDAALVVVSPGVPASLPLLEAARQIGIPVAGELEFASWYCRSRILAVTGTNGKTTTTELLHAMIRACGHGCLLAGNNATPLSAAVLEEPAPPYAVLEVSSYQLETVRRFRPWIGAVLNLSDDHLGRHGDMARYAEAKARLFQAQGAGDAAVLNADDPRTAAMPTPAEARRLYFSKVGRVEDGIWADTEAIRDAAGEVAARHEDNPLPGRHNLENVLAALAMARAGGFSWEGVLAGLRGFRGVEHRIEFVRSLDDVDYYNDSKSTNIDSLRVALESFERPVVLVAGGRGKGADYRVLRPLVQARVAAMITLGEDAPALEAAFGDLAPARRAGGMAEAVAAARACAPRNGVVLLSPGCASFDMYRNFEERGRDFKSCVHALR